MNTQKVTIELTRSGKFRLEGSQKVDDLNPKALMLCAAAKCAGLTIQAMLRKQNITVKMLEITVEGVLDTPEVQAGSHFPQLQRILQRAVQDTRRPECRKPCHRPDAGEILRHHRHAAHDRTRGT